MHFPAARFGCFAASLSHSSTAALWQSIFNWNLPQLLSSHGSNAKFLYETMFN
jgi:hypothetical protein